jgi:hypothetical protein
MAEEKVDFKLKLRLENLGFYLDSLYSEIGKSVESFKLVLKETPNGSITTISFYPSVSIVRKVVDGKVSYSVEELQPFFVNLVGVDETFKSLLLDVLKYIVDSKPTSDGVLVKYSKEK